MGGGKARMGLSLSQAVRVQGAEGRRHEARDLPPSITGDWGISSFLLKKLQVCFEMGAKKSVWVQEH